MTRLDGALGVDSGVEKNVDMFIFHPRFNETLPCVSPYQDFFRLIVLILREGV